MSRLDQLRTHPRRVLGALVFFVLAAALAAVCLGPLRLAPGTLWQAATGGFAELPAVDRSVLLDLRLPRAIGAILVGGILGMCGAAMQGLFRNPLADPGLIGVTAGASFGAALQVKFAATALAGVSVYLGQFTLPACALAGGLLATVIMHRASQVEGRTVVTLMLLAGVALNALFGAGIGLVLFFADDDQLRQFTFWTLGSLGRITWGKLAAAAPFLLFAVLLIPREARALNALLLGEAEAGHLGITLQRVKTRLILATASGVGAAVALAGGIGFIGLVVPHLVRQCLGPDHRWLLPGSALLGAALLLLADLGARLIAIPAELPVGVVTAALGAPVFLHLLRSRRHVLG